jgi:hypothetical protein
MTAMVIATSIISNSTAQQRERGRIFLLPRFLFPVNLHRCSATQPIKNI